MNHTGSTKTGQIRRLLVGIRRTAVLVVGVTVVLIGVCLLVLPGPGLLVIAGGLGLLALEFAWARRLFTGIKKGRGQQ